VRAAEVKRSGLGAQGQWTHHDRRVRMDIGHREAGTDTASGLGTQTN
jgi:hypothetical protein